MQILLEGELVASVYLRANESAIVNKYLPISNTWLHDIISSQIKNAMVL